MYHYYIIVIDYDILNIRYKINLKNKNIFFALQREKNFYKF